MTRVNRKARTHERGCRLMLVVSILTFATEGCQRGKPVSPSESAPQSASLATAPAHGDTVAPAEAAVASSGAAISAPDAIDVSWLPVDSQLVVQVQVQELLKTPLVRSIIQESDLLNQPTPLGVSARQIHSITAAAVAPTAKGESIQQGMLIVLRTTAPVAASVFERREDIERIASADRPMFRRRLDVLGTGPEFVALANPTTILVGSEAEVRAALSRGKGAQRRTAFGSSSRDHRLSASGRSMPQSIPRNLRWAMLPQSFTGF